LAQVTTWWAQVKGGYQTVVNDLNAAGSAAKADNESAAEQDCSQLTTDVQSLQSKPPAPLLSFNTPWQAALSDLAQGGEQCSSGISQDNTALVNQATTTFQNAENEIDKFNAQINTLP
jgi:hypothetical protein